MRNIRRIRRLLVILLALLLCVTIQSGMNVLNGAAIVIDAVVVGVLAVIELEKK